MAKGKDLGTYHLRVELADGRGWIAEHNTGPRFGEGMDGCHPLHAKPIPPYIGNEKDLIASTVFMYTEGNFSCDCNKKLFLARAYQQPDPDDTPCGDTMPLRRLTLIRPDLSELVIWEEEHVPEPTP